MGDNILEIVKSLGPLLESQKQDGLYPYEGEEAPPFPPPHTRTAVVNEGLTHWFQCVPSDCDSSWQLSIHRPAFSQVDQGQWGGGLKVPQSYIITTSLKTNTQTRSPIAPPPPTHTDTHTHTQLESNYPCVQTRSHLPGTVWRSLISFTTDRPHYPWMPLLSGDNNGWSGFGCALGHAHIWWKQLCDINYEPKVALPSTFCPWTQQLWWDHREKSQRASTLWYCLVGLSLVNET